MSEPIRVLYVDDYPLDRELVRDALEEEHGGFRLTEAASRQEFEARLAEGGYDLVLSDFNILGFEGLDVIDSVLARDPRLPVVIVTGTGSEEIAVEAMKRGAEDYVIKSPARIHRLPHTIHAVLEKRRLEEGRRQAQAALRESEERFRQIAETIREVFYVYDPVKDRFLYVSPTYEEIWQEPVHKVYDDPLSLAYAVHPEDRDCFLEVVRREREDGEYFNMEYRIVRPDGTVRWVWSRNYPILDETGAEHRVVGIAEDITERKRAEEALRESEARYRTLVETSPDAITLTDLQGNIVMCNSQSAALHGFESAQALVGKSAFQFFVPEEQELAFENMRQTLTKGRVENIEYTLPRADGTRCPVELSAALVTDSQGRPSGFMAIVRDITERKRAEEALRQLYEQTRQDAAAKAMLLQEVHHRVKNNLQIISSLLDLQAEEIRDSQVLDALQNSRHRVRAMALVHESLYQAPDLVHLDLGRYVRELLNYLVDAYEGPALRLDLDVQGEAVSLDLDRAIPCGLIVTELVSNALQHAFPNGRAGKIHIALRARDGQVELEVRDDGVGLPAEVDPQAATSLGLKIVQLLTRQLKGTLAVNSAVDRGATFTVTLPCAG